MDGRMVGWWDLRSAVNKARLWPGVCRSSSRFLWFLEGPAKGSEVVTGVSLRLGR